MHRGLLETSADEWRRFAALYGRALARQPGERGSATTATPTGAPHT